jgi:fatty-acyl-CoA synthase
MSRFVERIATVAARSAHGLTAGEPGEPVQRTWRQIHHDATGLAADLAANGVRPGDAVSVLAGDAACVAPAVQGVWLAGGSVTMLHQPPERTDLGLWQDATLRVVKMIDSHLVLVGPPFDHLADALRAAGIPFRLLADLSTRPDPAFTPLEVDEQEPALLQLTSGTTAEPKAVQITHGNVFANLSAAAERLGVRPESDAWVSWLPLSHDMGMTGALLWPMFTGIRLVSVTPGAFIRRPRLWAELLSTHRGTLTAAPNFAYAVLARHLERAAAGSLDLSSLRCAFNGAEPVDVETLDRFVAAGARFGMRPEAAVPCYGSAESTVTTSVSPDRPVVAETVSASELEANRRAVPYEGSEPTRARRLAILGEPAPGIEVRVVGDDGEPLPERHVGVLQLRGASITSTYLTADGPEAAQDADGWLDIGDEGYLADGNVVVCGRRKDVIIVGGRNIYPTEIERVAASAAGVRAGNVVAVRVNDEPGSGAGRESFAVLVESRRAGDEEAAATLADAVTAKVSADLAARPAVVRVIRPGTLPKTPSGKLRRGMARELL